MASSVPETDKLGSSDSGSTERTIEVTGISMRGSLLPQSPMTTDDRSGSIPQR